MSDMLAIGQSGVRAYARALDLVADNVANAATPGHVRRTATLSPVNAGGGKGPLELDPGGGSGVRLTAVSRAVDLLQMDTLRRAEGDVAALDVSARWLTSIEAAITGPNALDAPLNALFGAVSDLAGDPTNLAVRETLLARADALAGQFNRNAADLARLDEDLLAEAAIEGATMNDLSQALADVNGRLRRSGSGTAASAALADERDRLLARLGSLGTLDVTLDPLGQAEVRIPDAGGPLLVSGSDARSVRVIPSATGLELRVGPTGTDEPAPLLSGSIAGLSDARVQLTEARGRIDALATRIAEDFNTAHMQGVDDSGADGGALFETTLPLARPARANGGTARIDVSLADGAAVTAMTLGFDGTDWTLSRDDDGDSVSGPLPLTLDGHSVGGAGSARAGDQFRIEDAGGAAAIRLRPLDAGRIAPAQRWIAEPASANTGSAALELRPSASLPSPATPPFTLSHAGGLLTLTDSLGAVLGTGVPGGWIEGDGVSVRLTGAAADGDSFAIERNGAKSGANGNALALLALRDSGATTPGAEADALVSRVAVAAASRQQRFEIARENRNQAAEALSLASGVDLNSEATDMLRLQQAYGANARIIQAAREIFETLLQSSR
jgi:flagellar hook-associated protein 1 FlgK